jgi:hypothetical protein
LARQIISLHSVQASSELDEITENGRDGRYESEKK